MSWAADYIVATPTDITEVERRSFYDLIASSSLKVGHIKIRNPLLTQLEQDWI